MRVGIQMQASHYRYGTCDDFGMSNCPTKVSCGLTPTNAEFVTSGWLALGAPLRSLSVDSLRAQFTFSSLTTWACSQGAILVGVNQV
mmetsp:Transcript_28566/g.73293  ORF Transcript_28566/g.73293 Transcript_28566/m.73293 type:complete len:87 (+) Transcript_28566:375-635(+)